MRTTLLPLQSRPHPLFQGKSGSRLARSTVNRKAGGSSPSRDGYLAIQNPLLLDLTKKHAYAQDESVVGKKDVKTFSWSNGIIIFLNRK